MTGTKIMKKKILIALSLIVVLVMGSAEILYAADNGSMPDLSRENSTLKILTLYTDEDMTTPISGMEMTVYKVADLSVKDGVVNYTPTKEFESVKIDYNTMTTSSSIESAEKLYEVVEGGKLTGKKAVSDGAGVADIGTVDNGIYLVVQTKATGVAEEYSRIKPYIVMAPQSLAEIGENVWNYEVESIPKMEVVHKVVNLTKKVNEKDGIVIDNPANKFYYDIAADVTYTPDNFALVDNVPEELEVVDLKNIEITVNGNKVDEKTKEGLLKINGNSVRVEPTAEQIKEWAPFEMQIRFYCKFKDGIVLTSDNASIENVAGYEADKVYYEPKGKDNRAKVRAETEDASKVVAEEDTTATSTEVNDNDTRTGDMIARILPLLIALMAISALIIIIVLRRRKKTNMQD